MPAETAILGMQPYPDMGIGGLRELMGLELDSGIGQHGGPR